MGRFAFVGLFSVAKRKQALRKARAVKKTAKPAVDRKQEIAALRRELTQALERQTATSDVLKVISHSTFDLKAVLDMVAETACRLCGAECAYILRRDRDVYRIAAAVAFLPEMKEAVRQLQEYLAQHPLAPGRGSITGRVMLEGRVVHVTDTASDPEYAFREATTLGKLRTQLGVPLLREGIVVGTINLGRQRVEPFTEHQIELVRTFADQAVIAIENTRLMTETREALERQTATAEVLQVINTSPGNLTPIFDAMLEKAMRLCEATYGQVWRFDGEHLHAVAVHGDPTFVKWLGHHGPLPPIPGSAAGRIAQGENLVHIADRREEEAYRDDPVFRGLVDTSGVRTSVSVALRKDKTLLGMINVYRQEVRPYSDTQIALLQNFAAQAVIAMENARLINETREALEQQTATAAILQVINSSPGNLIPVFDAILQQAHRLCGVTTGALATYDGDTMRWVTMQGISESMMETMRQPFRPTPGSPHARMVEGRRIIHIPDLELDTLWPRDDPKRMNAIEQGVRTMLFVPLCKDDTLLGYFSATRVGVHPFRDKEVALMESFAAQAVIAMENARLINETREALEQQTATADILRVINASPGNLVPVFDAILGQAHRLCETTHGVLATYDSEHFRAVATRGLSGSLAALLCQPFRPAPNSAHAKLIAERRVVHVPDLTTAARWDENDPVRNSALEQGSRTILWVPLCKDDVLLGYISADRHEVRPFTDKEIALLESFAVQAVIAMDNARLLNEIRQRQAELRVTFDNMGDGVAMFDSELRLAAWNRNFQEILDLPDALLAARPSYADYIRLLAERGEFGTDDIEGELSRRLQATDREFRAERTRPDGHVIEVRRNVVPGGGFVLIYSDVTERKRAEEQIRAARDAAESALRDLRTAQASLIHAEKMASLGQLTAGIAHEIKNPLNFVNNFAGLSVELLDEFKEEAAPALAALDEGKRQEIDETIGMLAGNLQKIAEHGRRADGIVKSMLAHSRGSSGEWQTVNLNALVEEALNLAYHGARAQDQNFNITLEREFDPALALIELAPQDVTRVFLNLIGNGFYAAHKRSRETGSRPVLKVSTRDSGSAVEVRIRDNGTGIAPENRDRLFQPFFTTKPTGEGTGLGLSISYEIITQQHGGTIEVDSEVAAFTEFTVRLPRVRRVAPGGRAT